MRISYLLVCVFCVRLARKENVLENQMMTTRLFYSQTIWICLGVLRTLGFCINFRQLAINGL